MYRKFRFACTLAAAVGLQAVPAQALQAPPVQNLSCAIPPQNLCGRWQSMGFASAGQCIDFFTSYCAVISDPNGGCYFDPRQGQTICL